MITKLDDSAKKRLASLGKSVKSTVQAQKQGPFPQGAENITLLYNCARDWDALRPTRESRLRNLRYKSGDQWGDIVRDPDDEKKFIREDVLITRQGRVPLKHNFIQQFFRNIHGQLLSNPTQTIVHARSLDDQNLSDMLTNTIQANHQLNDMATLDINMLEELLSGGIGVAKISYQYWSEHNKHDAKINMVNTNRLFFNQDFEDPRLFDLRRIGEVHDYTYDELMNNFAKDKKDEAELKSIYTAAKSQFEVGTASEKYLPLLDFFGSGTSQDKYRVIEVWERIGRWVLYCHDYLEGTEEVLVDGKIEQIKAINDERLNISLQMGIAADDVPLIYAEEQYEYYWQVKFLTPNGLCLKEMETPYKHESHPYVFGAMPIVDGRVLPVMSDLIDLQRYINRLVVMIDFIMGSSAKGVLMVPEECIPEGYDINDFSKSWVKTNGVILISKEAKGSLPTEISTNATNIGAWEMLSMEMNMISQISGLSGAAQGQLARPGMAASLYAQEAQNSMLNYVLVFDRHNAYCQKRDEKLLKVIMQYYDTPRYVDINGKAFDEMAKIYEPELAKNVTDYNLVTSKSFNTPIFKQMADTMLQDMLNAGLIPMEVYLNNSSMPFASKLAADLKNYQEKVQEGQFDTSQGQALEEEALKNADPKAIEMMSKFVKGEGSLAMGGEPS